MKRLTEWRRWEGNSGDGKWMPLVSFHNRVERSVLILVVFPCTSPSSLLLVSAPFLHAVYVIKWG